VRASVNDWPILQNTINTARLSNLQLEDDSSCEYTSEIMSKVGPEQRRKQRRDFFRKSGLEAEVREKMKRMKKEEEASAQLVGEDEKEAEAIGQAEEYRSGVQNWIGLILNDLKPLSVSDQPHTS
jgi:hypothetical protein